MLVQFERAITHDVADAEFLPDSGEDEGFGQPAAAAEPTPVYVDINPRYVSVVFESREPGVTIVKGPDGRGFKVKGNYAEVHAKLVAAGMETPDTQH